MEKTARKEAGKVRARLARELAKLEPVASPQIGAQPRPIFARVVAVNDFDGPVLLQNLDLQTQRGTKSGGTAGLEHTIHVC